MLAVVCETPGTLKAEDRPVPEAEAVPEAAIEPEPDERREHGQGGAV